MVKRTTAHWILALVLATTWPTAARANGELARQVVIVYNAQEPESKPLAEYYAKQRGVPTDQICAINVRPVETITRQEYDHDVSEPIWRFLCQRGLMAQEPAEVRNPLWGDVPSIETTDSRISFVVLMYGVPLRIDRDPSIVEKISSQLAKELRHNEASVETELAMLPTMGLPVTGPLRNLFFSYPAPRLDGLFNRHVLMVGRLDGPDPQIVRRMIDDALAAERYGLLGRVYLDGRGIREGGYAEGDAWIRSAYEMFRQAGFECDFDEQEGTFGEDYPFTDVAIYAGWYAPHANGPFRRAGFQFKRGAIAYHIHSLSGASVRSRQTYWVGPLLALGAAATMGNVFEPYLSLTPHIDLFFQRLLNGGTFLEAGYFCQPVVSWQTTFVGDPLYRPFALTADEQIARLEADKQPDVRWAYLRKVNLLLAQGHDGEAEALCRAKADAYSSKALFEKLGDLLHDSRRDPEAIAAYKKAQARGDDPRHAIRIVTKLANAYIANNQPAPALAVYEQFVADYPQNKNLPEIYKKARELAKTLGDAEAVKAWQAKISAATIMPPSPP